ncbi:MAG: glycosyltransferase [Actinomycetia bacterium]|nr:glycosyltransferase [Actinomycetes bacterium]
MRIGLFCDMYMPHVSGVTNHIRLYKRYYEDQGHEVYLFTFGNHDYEDDEPNVIRTRGFEWGETGWNLSPQFGSEARSLIPTLDIVHTHHPFQSGYLLLPFAQRYDLPLVFTNHTRYDLYSDAYAAYVPPTLRHGLLSRTLSLFLNQCDMVITPSASICDWLSEFVDYRYGNVISNGIDIEMFASPASTLTRGEVGLRKDATVFCYSGRIAPEKNVLYLFDEFRAAHEQLPDTQLLLIGGGPDLDQLRELVAAHDLKDDVICTGMQPYEMLPTYEQLSDIFVTGSVSEVHPLVVLEAMAAQLPVIAIDSPGIRETVSHNFNGLLADQVAPGALGYYMMMLASDDALRHKLTRGAKSTIANYTLPHTAGSVLSEYERLVNRKILAIA